MNGTNVRIGFLALWIFLLLAAQMTLAERIAIGRAAPDFLALAAVFVAMYVPRREAICVGALAGLAGDMLMSDRLGPMALSLACACAALATLRPRQGRATAPTGLLAAALTVFAANALYGSLRALGWGGAAVDGTLALALKIAAYSAPLAMLVFPVMVFTAGALGYPARCRALHTPPPPEAQQAGPSGYPLNPRD